MLTYVWTVRSIFSGMLMSLGCRGSTPKVAGGGGGLSGLLKRSMGAYKEKVAGMSPADQRKEMEATRNRLASMGEQSADGTRFGLSREEQRKLNEMSEGDKQQLQDALGAVSGAGGQDGLPGSMASMLGGILGTQEDSEVASNDEDEEEDHYSSEDVGEGHDDTMADAGAAGTLADSMDTAGQGAGGIKDMLARAKKGEQIGMAEMMGLMIGSALSDESMKELEDNMRKKGLA